MAETKQASTTCWPVKCGGGGEIRTLGWFPIGGFQDRCLKPLGHPSAMTRTINIPFSDVKRLSVYSPEKQPDCDFSL